MNNTIYKSLEKLDIKDIKIYNHFHMGFKNKETTDLQNGTI